MKTTSYDYDAPLNEYGFLNNPKYTHLRDLHQALNRNADVLLSTNSQQLNTSVENTDIYVYGNLNVTDSKLLVFVSNWDTEKNATVQVFGQTIMVPPFSVLMFTANGTDKPLNLEFSTFDVKPNVPVSIYSDPAKSPLTLSPEPESISFIPEPLPSVSSIEKKYAVSSQSPLEQFRTTVDVSDYLWYIRSDVRISKKAEQSRIDVNFDKIEDVGHIWIDGKFSHSLVNGNMPKVPIAGATDLPSSNSSETNRAVTVSSASASLEVDAISDKPHTITVLSSVAGVENYGGHYENFWKGIKGNVTVSGVNVTDGAWTHVIGLEGERQGFANTSVPQKWNSLVSLPSLLADLHVDITKSPLMWYKITFSKAKLLELSAKALANVKTEQGVSPMPSFALKLSSMGRGQAYVNGFHIGRFWDKVADCKEKDTDVCKMPYDANKCPVGCGKPSQEWYHVPTSWLNQTEGNDVSVVLFSENGGYPSGVLFAAIAG